MGVPWPTYHDDGYRFLFPSYKQVLIKGLPIGTGVLFESGYDLSVNGSVSLLLAYILMGTVMYAVIVSLLTLSIHMLMKQDDFGRNDKLSANSRGGVHPLQSDPVSRNCRSITFIDADLHRVLQQAGCIALATLSITPIRQSKQPVICFCGLRSSRAFSSQYFSSSRSFSISST
jgi:hypothetical protein